MKISLKQAALAASMLLIAVPAFAAKSAQDMRKEKVAQIPPAPSRWAPSR